MGEFSIRVEREGEKDRKRERKKIRREELEALRVKIRFMLLKKELN